MASLSIPQCQPGSTGPCWYSTPCNPETESSTRETVAQMCGHIREAADDPYIQQLAGQAYQMYSGRGALIAPGDYTAAAAAAAWWWCKEHMKFVPDEIQLGQLLGKQAQDFLIAPGVMARARRRKGDCDCFTMMLLSLLSALGVPWKICTVKCQKEMPWRWSHVYSCVTLADGSRLPLDASHGKYPGWEVPAGDVFEYAEWDCNGARVPVQVQPMPMGQYRPRPLVPSLRRVRGLGDDCSSDPNCLAALNDSGLTSGDLLGLPGEVGPSGGVLGGASTGSFGYYDSNGNYIVPLAGGGYTSSNASGSATLSGSLPSPAPGQSIPASGGGISADLTSIFNQVTRTIGGIIQPTATYQLANGTVVSAPAGSQAAAQLSASLGGISPTTLLIGAVLIGGALLLFGGKH